MSTTTSPSPEPSAIPVQPPTPLPVHAVTITAQLTYHITVPALGAKGKPKDKKEQKTKELKHSFTPTSENYIDLLNALLAKHGEEKYNITAKKRFSFKALVPPSKACIFSSCSVFSILQ
jgi:hypothetical protein